MLQLDIIFREKAVFIEDFGEWCLDCKSAIVGSAPTGASQKRSTREGSRENCFSGYFRFIVVVSRKRLAVSPQGYLRNAINGLDEFLLLVQFGNSLAKPETVGPIQNRLWLAPGQSPFGQQL